MKKSKLMQPFTLTSAIDLLLKLEATDSFENRLIRIELLSAFVKRYQELVQMGLSEDQHLKLELLEVYLILRDRI